MARVKPVTIAKEAGSDVQISAGLSGTESIIIGDALAGLKVLLCVRSMTARFSSKVDSLHS
jgi:hypothetical protein